MHTSSSVPEVLAGVLKLLVGLQDALAAVLDASAEVLDALDVVVLDAMARILVGVGMLSYR